MSKYICLNGEFIKSENAFLSVLQDGMLYGDGIFEDIHCNGAQPHFFSFHFKNLIRSVKTIGLSVPPFFSEDFVLKNCKGVLNRNKHFQGAKIRIIIFRNNETEKDPFSLMIESQSLPHADFRLNVPGLIIDIYPEMHKPVNLISGIRSNSALFYFIVERYRKKAGLSECIILNEYERVCESVHSNIFILKKNEIITPGLQEGCIPSVMREILVNLMISQGYSVKEDGEIVLKELPEADELFLADAVNGIRWVLAFRQKRYYNRFSKMLIEKLNELLKSYC